MNVSIELSRREAELIVEELRNLVVPARLQRVYESTPERLVLEFRAPGTTYHLLVATESNDTRLHLVDGKPDQPDHPSPFTMQLRKWLHGAWLEAVDISDRDRVVSMHLEAIDPQWEPTRENEEAPRLDVTLVAELLGRHPNVVLLDADDRIITTGPGGLLGDRDTAPETAWKSPPPPPDWADTENVRPMLRGVAGDGSRSRMLARHFEHSLEEQKRRELKHSLDSALDDRYDKIDRRIENIRGDLERIDDAEEYRRRGELLQAAYGDVERGSSSAMVPDFYEDGLPEVEIPLDPSKSLQENIDEYFHEYRRLTEARDKVENRLLDSIEQRDEIENVRRRLEELEQLEELREFQEQLRKEGLLPDQSRPSRSGPRRQEALPPYREFRATSDSPILVGRNAEANDTLTTTVARGRDMWLHARNFPGSHVVLRMRKDEELKSEDLVDAATLAAYFSEGRRDTVVEVTYIKAKHVRKPKGAPPGSVTIGGGGSTIAVRIEDERLEGLLDGEISHR